MNLPSQLESVGHGRTLHHSVDSSASFQFYTTGLEQLPIIGPPTREVKPSRLELFTAWNTASNTEAVALHFYVDDSKIERVVEKPLLWSSRLASATAVITPDMSLYAHYPPSLRCQNTRSNRLAAATWQAMGINIIVNQRWNDPSDYEFCFAGSPRKCQVAVSSVSMLRDSLDRRNFVHGFQEMIERLEPTSIIFYGSMPRELPKSARSKAEILHYPSRAAIAFSKGRR